MAQKNTKSKKNGFHDPLTGTTWNKKVLIGTGLGAVLITIIGNLWHGFIMMDVYNATSWLWRPHEEMDPLLLTVFMLAMGAMISVLFHHGYKGGHWREGARFGLIITLLFAPIYGMMYQTQPITTDLIAYWIAGDSLMFITSGIALAWWYGRK